MGVVFHHAALSVQAFASAPMPAAIYSALNFGYLGVDFFFVLSGFIILHSHLGDPSGIGPAKSYFTKRLLRVFPPYLPISISLFLAYALLPGLSEGIRGGEFGILSSFFLLPSEYPPALSVAWTLIHEMLFYMVFLTFFASKKAFFGLAIAWSCVMFFNSYSRFTENGLALFKVLLDPINLEFVLGMAAAWIASRTRFRPNAANVGVLLMAAGVSLFFILLPLADISTRYLFGLPFTLLVLGGALFDLTFEFKYPKWLVALGDASYAIYLVHNPLLSLASRAFNRLHLPGSWQVMLLFGALLSALGGILYHRFFERPAIRFLRKRMTFVSTTQAATRAS